MRYSKEILNDLESEELVTLFQRVVVDVVRSTDIGEYNYNVNYREEIKDVIISKINK